MFFAREKGESVEREVFTTISFYKCLFHQISLGTLVEFWSLIPDVRFSICLKLSPQILEVIVTDLTVHLLV